MITALANQYRRILLGANNLQTVPISPSIAESAAQLRSDSGLRTPDAIQLATALEFGASSFLTNDVRLQGAIRSKDVLVLSRLG